MDFMLPVLSVTEFINQINGIIAGEFIIEGEVSQYKISQGKWIFFDLKDEQSALGCFSSTFSLKTPLEDGMKIRVIGYPSIYAKTGRFSLTVQKVELAGEGALKRAYELLKKKLADEGLFNPERKRELPKLPQKIGVIASRESAAFGDFKRILNNRWSGVDIVLRHAQVQGERAVDDVVRAFADFDSCAQKDRPDVIVLIRGGGSLEDLAAFNTEEVARAVYNCRIPVLAAIGHERDVSLAELAADVRASTPSNAAEIVVPDKKDFFESLEFDLERVSQQIKNCHLRKLHSVEQAFSFISGRLEAPLTRVRFIIEKFGGCLPRMQYIFNQKNEFVLFAERMIKNSDPKFVLKKGYSITRNKKGAIIRKAWQVAVGDEIVVELSEGCLWGKTISSNEARDNQKSLFEIT